MRMMEGKHVRVRKDFVCKDQIGGVRMYTEVEFIGCTAGDLFSPLISAQLNANLSVRVVFLERP